MGAVRLLVGRRALLQRAGFSPRISDEIRNGQVSENMIPWERVRGFGDDGSLQIGPPVAAGSPVAAAG